MVLLLRSKSDWDQSYYNAAKLLQSDPIQLEKLDKIYGNPKYYTGYYLKSKVGNLNLNRSGAAKYAAYLTSDVLEDGSTNIRPAKSNPNTCPIHNIM